MVIVDYKIEALVTHALSGGLRQSHLREAHLGCAFKEDVGFRV